jgi:predicted Zn-dependent protease
MTPRTKLLLSLAATSILAAAGCSNSGNSPSSGAGGIAGTGIKFGDFLPSQAQQYAPALDNTIAAASVNEADEDELGRTVAIAATNKWRLYEDPAVTKYVTLVGLTVAAASDNPDGDWVFGVLDTPEIGAYSGPNGYVLVTRGSINLMRDEAELAGILAHEIAHCVNHDGLNAVRGAKLTAAAVSAGTAQIKEPHIANFVRTGDALNKVIFNVGWSQGQETSADTTAVHLLTASGYDPAGLTRFLQRVQQRQGGGARLFGSHPGTADRISRLTNLTAGAKPGATNRDRFAKSVAPAKL